MAIMHKFFFHLGHILLKDYIPKLKSVPFELQYKNIRK